MIWHSMKNNYLVHCGRYLTVFLFLLITPDLWGQIAKNSELKIVVGGDHKYPPYEFINEQGMPDGFNVEITKAIGKVMGMTVEVRLGGWSEMRTALEKGEIDALQGIVYSKERAKIYDFSPPHSIVHNSIWVRVGAEEVHSLNELEHKKVVLQKDGIVHDYLRETNLQINFVPTQTHAHALHQLILGNYDYAVVSKLPGQFYLNEIQAHHMVDVTVPVTSHRYGYAVVKGNYALLGRISEGLATLRKTGQYQEIYDKWLGVLEPQGVSAKTIFRYGMIVIIPLLLGLAASILWSRILKRQVANRTIDLENEMKRHKEALDELKRQQKQLIQADKLASLGILVSGVAHEINNPSGLILMNLPLVRDVYLDALPILDEYNSKNEGFTLGGLGYSKLRDEIPAIIDEMQESVTKIKRIVEDLKNFARKDNSVMELNVNLNDVVKRSIRLTTNSIRKSTDYFHVDYADNMINIMGNNQRIEQVVVNLILNACQALESLEKKIEVRTEVGKNSVKLIVKDEGCGITAEHLDHLTDPFFTTKREVGGTGLGLSISDGIVKDHGGKLEFASILGFGTTVTMKLPLEHTELT